MSETRSASLALDLALVVILFVVLAFAAAYRPDTTQTDHYREDVITLEDGAVADGNAGR